MIVRDQVALLLSELAALIGADGLQLDEAGTCTLVFDGRLFVEIECDDNAGAVVLSARLGPVPADAAVLVYRHLLSSNVMWRETSGVATAIDPGTGDALLLCRVDAADINLPAFRALLERFVDQAEDWSRVLARLEDEPAAATTPNATAALPSDELMIKI
jgi:hypothetical protein